MNEQDKQREEAKHKMLYAMIETLPNGRDFLECVNELIKRDSQKTQELERSEKLLEECVNALKLASTAMSVNVPSSQTQLYRQWIEIKKAIDDVIKTTSKQ